MDHYRIHPFARKSMFHFALSGVLPNFLIRASEKFLATKNKIKGKI
jgi:hypothetical protein